MSSKLVELMFWLTGLAIWALLLYWVKRAFMRQGRKVSLWSAEAILMTLIFVSAVVLVILL